MKLLKIVSRDSLSPGLVGAIAYAGILVGVSKVMQGTVRIGSSIRGTARNRPATIR